MCQPISVSVIIPVYNGDRYLAETIDSVLAQSVPAFEVLVIDDGSSDRTAEVVKRYRSVRYYHQTNRGAAAARNWGADLARGNVLAFLDADDLWTANKLELQTIVLAKNSHVDMVLGKVKEFYSSDMPDELKKQFRYRDRALLGYNPSTLLVRSRSFFRVGKFETSLQIAECVEWYLRAKQMNLQTVMLSEIVTWRRLHGGNQTIVKRASKHEYAKIIKQFLDRQRAMEDRK